jgi:hypothetical protein
MGKLPRLGLVARPAAAPYSPGTHDPYIRAADPAFARPDLALAVQHAPILTRCCLLHRLAVNSKVTRDCRDRLATRFACANVDHLCHAQHDVLSRAHRDDLLRIAVPTDSHGVHGAVTAMAMRLSAVRNAA